MSGPRYAEFASKILNQRIDDLSLITNQRYPKIEELFPALTNDEEAEVLGVADAVRSMIREKTLSPAALAKLEGMKWLEAYFILIWANARSSVEEALLEKENDESSWRTRYENYKYATLFTIKQGKSGYRKAYCGWSTFVALSGGNIRYLIELVDQTLTSHMSTSTLNDPVPWQVQTRSAMLVGRKNVSELEGVDVNGALLTKLVLGLGRIFQVMARDVSDHAPEITQFELASGQLLDGDTINMLRAGVMHLALVRYSSTKLAGQEYGDYDYSLHPIFAPFFEYSYRKKRKMKLAPRRLMEITRAPGSAIPLILREQNRDVIVDLPEQLGLFGGFYGSGN